MEAAMGVDDSKRNEALDVIKSDCGIQLLLPRFSLAIAEGVRCNVAMKNLAFLIYHMRVLQSLNLNKTVNLERVVSFIIVIIMICLPNYQTFVFSAARSSPCHLDLYSIKNSLHHRKG